MTATILVADDDAAIRTVVRQALTRAGHVVKTCDSVAALWALVDAGEGDVVVTDVILPDADGLDAIPRLLARRPGLPVIVMSAQNTLSTAVRATEQGAFDYLPKPFDIDALARAVASALAASGHVPEAAVLPGDDLPLIGRSPAMQAVYRIIARVVPTDLSVMILGESGTGKELVARALHDLGPRRAGPFVALNMAAIPRELIETELFGHERGAFTGAAARVTGRFEQAQGGTLFLDEIGDMPADAQTRLLRVLQSGDFTTVGGNRTIRADVRIISATNQDLAKRIAGGQFREDLFYRLNVVPLHLPALRERGGDIAILARHFLDRAAADGLPRKALDAGAIEVLGLHAWPGNVRELENLMRRLAALTSAERIDASDVAAELRGPGTVALPATNGGLAASVAAHLADYFAIFGDDLPPDGLYDRILAEVERPLLTQALSATRGNQIRAAKLLGINRNTLRKMLGDHKLDASAARRL
ncbi:nitrogen regulation protein NR(I) [Glacieibacterium frigidum]|uniref:DNA-binding transcriptional regulator NtrC n=1 Tax=Glacieibacterium frigidum TaxID=2593303 RepID=A0A552UIE9_9SPHN|nr:nitrogen regulation protein NR(I) [Glacieibacterium frigidum]TRW17999.1 nitrogen regulation protein NR(I) [Glacieibacterium frigidum]